MQYFNLVITLIRLKNTVKESLCQNACQNYPFCHKLPFNIVFKIMLQKEMLLGIVLNNEVLKLNI